MQDYENAEDRPAAPLAESWTIQRVLTWSTSYLKERQPDSPRLDAEILLGHVLGLSRIQLYTNFDKPLKTDEREPFKELLRRRLGGEPVAYVIGKKDFMGLTFAVTRDVLIPRPDTEVLVEQTLALTKDREAEALRILDVGSGSGCVALALAKRLPAATVESWDVSEPALAVARANAERLGITENAFFVRQDALADAAWDDSERLGAFDLVVSNPPYIGERERATLSPSVARFEPDQALFAGEDGLNFYRRFARSARRLMKPGGVFLAEIGYAQAGDVTVLFAAEGWSSVTIAKDYAKHDRVVIARV